MTGNMRPASVEQTPTQAYLQHVGDVTMSQATDRPTTIPSRRAFLAAGPAVAAAALAAGGAVNIIATATARQPAPDLVYAAIKQEREAHAAYLVTGEILSQISGQDPCPPTPGKNGKYDDKANAKRMARPDVKVWWARSQEADAAHEKSAQQLWSAREAFLQTQPTTVAGLFAFLDHIDGPFTEGSVGEAFWDDNERELAFPTLAAGVRALVDGRRA